MRSPRLYVVGAGLAGLSAAVESARQSSVTVFESAGQAGGRCRSYFDSTIGQTIDNGNHLLLSGNHAVMRYLKLIGASDKLIGPVHAGFDFADVRSNERWRLSPNMGPLPFWIFRARRRVPGTHAADYLSFAKLSAASDVRIGDVVPTTGALWDRLLAPFLIAALNTDPAEGSAALAGRVIRETLAKGEAACRPRIAHPTLAAAFIDPALSYLQNNAAEVKLNRRVRKLVFDEARSIVMALEFSDGVVPVNAEDRVILSVPPWVASDLIPGLDAPDDFRSILNLHFAVKPPAHASSSEAVGDKNNFAPEMLGVIGGTAEWIFTFPERISVTVSNADRLIDEDRETLARRVWADIAKLYGLPETLPVWQVVKEKRATFAATPAQNAKRPPAKTRWTNLLLAGDWTDTGLPATVEGAIRSGVKAAQLAASRASR